MDILIFAFAVLSAICQIFQLHFQVEWLLKSLSFLKSRLICYASFDQGWNMDTRGYFYFLNQDEHVEV